MATALGEVGADPTVGYCACLRRELSGEPDVGNLHLRFDEGRVGRIHIALSPTLPPATVAHKSRFNQDENRISDTGSPGSFLGKNTAAPDWATVFVQNTALPGRFLVDPDWPDFRSIRSRARQRRQGNEMMLTKHRRPYGRSPPLGQVYSIFSSKNEPGGAGIGYAGPLSLNVDSCTTASGPTNGRLDRASGWDGLVFPFIGRFCLDAGSLCGAAG